MAFRSFDFSDYDVVLSITSAEAKFIKTNNKQLHICYCLTPTRYLWSHLADYQNQGFKGLILKLFKTILQKQDLVAASKVNQFIAISKTVKARIKKYYHRDSLVIYPPVNFPKLKFQSQKPKENNYYLLVSRLVPYKRVDLAIKACNELDRNLIVVGVGTELKSLKKIAGSKIKFISHLTDKGLSG